MIASHQTMQVTAAGCWFKTTWEQDPTWSWHQPALLPSMKTHTILNHGKGAGGLWLRGGSVVRGPKDTVWSRQEELLRAFFRSPSSTNPAKGAIHKALGTTHSPHFRTAKESQKLAYLQKPRIHQASSFYPSYCTF